jgi:hypothetical protein
MLANWHEKTMAKANNIIEGNNFYLEIGLNSYVAKVLGGQKSDKITLWVYRTWNRVE